MPHDIARIEQLIQNGLIKVESTDGGAGEPQRLTAPQTITLRCGCTVRIA